MPLAIFRTKHIRIPWNIIRSAFHLCATEHQSAVNRSRMLCIFFELSRRCLSQWNTIDQIIRSLNSNRFIIIDFLCITTIDHICPTCRLHDIKFVWMDNYFIIIGEVYWCENNTRGKVFILPLQHREFSTTTECSLELCSRKCNRKRDRIPLIWSHCAL